MEALFELVRVSVQPINLPLTILLVLAVLYWLLVLAGFLSADDGGGDLGGGGEVGGSAHMEVEMNGAGHHHFASLHAVMKFLHVGEAPLFVIVSVLVLCAWAFAVLANYYLNPDGALGLGALLLLPNLLLSVLLTRALTKPLRVVFRALNKDYDQHEPIVGQVCTVTTGEVNTSFGQGTVEIRGAPLLLQVRTSDGEVLHRGDRALIISEDKEKNYFRVIKYNEPKLED
jgi:hypothetical protein